MYLTFILQTKDNSRQTTRATAIGTDSPPPAKATAKAAAAKIKPAIDGTTDYRGRVYAPRQLVQIAPEHQALSKCNFYVTIITFIYNM